MRYSKKTNFNTNLGEFIIIKKSLIPGAGFGAFAKKTIMKNEKIGEYNGKLLNTISYESLRDKSYVFEVAKKYQSKYHLFYIDAKHKGEKLKYINGACSSKQKRRINVQAYQYAERIFFRTKKEIPEGEELLIDYGDNYWE